MKFKILILNMAILVLWCFSSANLNATVLTYDFKLGEQVWVNHITGNSNDIVKAVSVVDVNNDGVKEKVVLLMSNRVGSNYVTVLTQSNKTNAIAKIIKGYDKVSFVAFDPKVIKSNQKILSIFFIIDSSSLESGELKLGSKDSGLNKNSAPKISNTKPTNNKINSNKVNNLKNNKNTNTNITTTKSKNTNNLNKSSNSTNDKITNKKTVVKLSKTQIANIVVQNYKKYEGIRRNLIQQCNNESMSANLNRKGSNEGKRKTKYYNLLKSKLKNICTSKFINSTFKDFEYALKGETAITEGLLYSRNIKGIKLDNIMAMSGNKVVLQLSLIELGNAEGVNYSNTLKYKVTAIKLGSSYFIDGVECLNKAEDFSGGGE